MVANQRLVHSPFAELLRRGWRNHRDVVIVAHNHCFGLVATCELLSPSRPFRIRDAAMFQTMIFQTAIADHTADVVAFAKFRDDGREIWFNSFDNGFQMVRFSERFIATHQDLFNQ